MPTYTLDVDVTDDQERKIQKWFPKWNVTLAAPYATFKDALIDIVKHQIRSFVDTSEDPQTMAIEFQKATPEVKLQILQLLDLD